MRAELITLICEQCGNAYQRRAAELRYRQAKSGVPARFCGQRCFGLSRRSDTRTPSERRADKSEYDRAYRERTREKKRQQAKEWFRKNYDPVKAAEERKARMPQHVEYCRQPAYREKKRAYDRRVRAAVYGPFADAFLILQQLQREILRRMPDKYERLKARGYYERQNEKARAKRRARL